MAAEVKQSRLSFPLRRESRLNGTRIYADSFKALSLLSSSLRLQQIRQPQLTTARTKGTKVLKVNFSKQETKMKTNSEEKEIIEQYSLAMNVTLFERILFYISIIMVSVWFLVPLYNPTKFPLLIFIIVSVPIVIHNIIALPKHIRIIHSYGLYFDPWLNTKCALHAYYPSKDFLNKYPWFKVVHYLMILFPVACSLLVVLIRFTINPKLN